MMNLRVRQARCVCCCIGYLSIDAVIFHQEIVRSKPSSFQFSILPVFTRDLSVLVRIHLKVNPISQISKISEKRKKLEQNVFNAPHEIELFINASLETMKEEVSITPPSDPVKSRYVT